MLSKGLLPLVDFPGQGTGWKSRCLRCDSIVSPHFSTIVNSVKHGLDRACSVCGARKAQQARRETYFQKLPGLLGARNFRVAGIYQDAKTPTAFACTICDLETKTTADSILRGGKTCKCQKRPRQPISKHFPELARELHQDLNGPLTPDLIGTGMRAKVWWKCPEAGHIHDASPANRVQGKKCRYCAGIAAYPGDTDLATTHPELCLELAGSQPELVSARTLKSGSNTVANWVCKKNPQHIYPASPYERISRGAGCSFCAGKRVLIGDNDLISTNPEVAAEWDYERNFPQRPEFFTSGSNKHFHWRCSWNPAHSWAAPIASRTKGHGCNQCARVQLGRNDLETKAKSDEVRGHLLVEWDYDKNSKNPSEVAFSDNDDYWWKCGSQKHAPYLAQCSNRWFSLTGCPTCSPSAYSTAKPGKFYFLSNAELNSLKVGITNVSAKTDRLKRFLAHGWSLQMQLEDDGLLVKRLEQRMLYIIREEWKLPPHLQQSQMKKMGGATETFSSDFATLAEIKSLIEFEFRLLKEAALE
jgi:hypothetical protein